MSITPEQVKNIAHLARLDLDPADLEKYAQDMNSILAWVEQMSQVNTTGIQPMAHPQNVHQRLREDQAVEPNQREKFQAIAPKVEAGLYLVPQVIE